MDVVKAVGPVFVAGCPRSGTSALSWAIAAHPLYWTSVESHYFYYLLRDQYLSDIHARSSADGSWLNVHQVSYREFLVRIGEGLDGMIRARSKGLHWVDGSPENLLVGEELLTMYPTAKIVQVVRDPAAVCLSMLTSGFQETWASDLKIAIETWCHYAQVGLDLVRAFPNRVLLIRHHDMMRHPQAVATELGRRLCLTDVKEIASFLENTRINSSLDRNSYVEGSPYHPATGAISSAADLVERNTSEIMAKTAEILDGFKSIQSTNKQTVKRDRCTSPIVTCVEFDS